MKPSKFDVDLSLICVIILSLNDSDKSDEYTGDLTVE